MTETIFVVRILCKQERKKGYVNYGRFAIIMFWGFFLQKKLIHMFDLGNSISYANMYGNVVTIYMYMYIKHTILQNIPYLIILTHKNTLQSYLRFDFAFDEQK